MTNRTPRPADPCHPRSGAHGPIRDSAGSHEFGPDCLDIPESGTDADVRAEQEMDRAYSRAQLRVGSEHRDDATCWCQPRKSYEDPATGTQVWVHQDGNN